MPIRPWHFREQLTAVSFQIIWRAEDPRWDVRGIPEILYSDNGSDFTFQRGKERFAPSDVLRPERREER